MENEEIIVKITQHNEEIGNLKHRVSECEENQKEMRQLIKAVDKLAVNMQNMIDEQKEQGQRLTRLEQAPTDDYKYYKRVIGAAILTGVLGAVLGAILALVIK